ncbi:laminin subunit alpha-2-like, partial, partial [Tachysurus ichikawai]
MAKISANATCGENRPEMFCKLVEHVPGQPVRNPQCRVCNLRSERIYGLFPAVLNLASMAKISANATCGENRPEMFCKLVEHVPGQPVRNPQCRVCNLRSERIY